MKTCILKFDHISNLLRRLYYIDALKLQFIDAYFWKISNTLRGTHVLYFWNLSFI